MDDPKQLPPGQLERRLLVRVQLSEPLMARHIGRTNTFLVEEASLGGFSLRSDVVFQEGTEHHFRVASPTGQVAIVAAVCPYCTAIPGSPKLCTISSDSSLRHNPPSVCGSS